MIEHIHDILLGVLVIGNLITLLIMRKLHKKSEALLKHLKEVDARLQPLEKKIGNPALKVVDTGKMFL